MKVFFRELTKRNWGAPYHAIIVFIFMQVIIKVFNVENMNNLAMMLATVFLVVITIIYELYQIKKGQTKQGAFEDILFNLLGYLAAILPILNFSGEGMIFALTLPAFLKKDKLKIVIDPGHGGKFTGAVYNGIKESILNWKYAHRIGNLLMGKGHDVLFTRVNKELKSKLIDDLKARVELANEVEADLFISCHCNASKSKKARGLEVYTCKGQTDSDKVAELVLNQIAKDLPDVKLRVQTIDGDKDHEANFYVLTKTKMPAILIEFGFMSNETDMEKLKSYLYLENVSQAIVKAIS